MRPCAECFADPGPAIDDSPLREADPHLLAHEAWLIAGRDALDALANGQEERREDGDSQDRIGAATIIKARDCALKYERAYLEVYNARKQLEHDRELISHDKEMAGTGRAH